ncbi:hypothetical protein EK21DRAFT_75511, partial [Setomelanomma holmii]
LYFKLRASDVALDDQPSLVASYIRGEAAKWVRPFLLKYMGSDLKSADLVNMFKDYDHFKEKVRTAFRLTNETKIAERVI